MPCSVRDWGRGGVSCALALATDKTESHTMNSPSDAWPSTLHKVPVADPLGGMDHEGLAGGALAKSAGAALALSRDLSRERRAHVDHLPPARAHSQSSTNRCSPVSSIAALNVHAAAGAASSPR